MASRQQFTSNEPEPELKKSRRKRCTGKRTAPKKLACSVGKADPFKAGSSRRESNSEAGNRGDWSALPVDIQDCILSKLEYKHLFQTTAVSKWFIDRIGSDGFHGCRGELSPSEGLLTALHFSVGDHGAWQCAGYDLTSGSWKKLPPFRMLPQLDPTLFKDHFMCGAGGIMCANVSTSSSMRVSNPLIVFNPLTGRWKELPSLHHPRNPVLMQMVVDSSRDSYKIIVAGSARAGHENLSKITEVFDSRTSLWTVTQDLPGPLFALNKRQTGVYVNGVLFCIVSLGGAESDTLGVLAFNVNKGMWLPHLACPLPTSTNLNIVQLVDSKGEIVVFSEIEHENPYNRIVEHRIDKLEEVVVRTNLLTNSAKREGTWRNVMSETKMGNPAGLQVYPEYTCVPFGEGKLCIFNTIAHTGIVYNVHSGERIETLSSPTWSGSGSGEMGLHSMNPLGFSFEPSFKGEP